MESFVLFGTWRTSHSPRFNRKRGAADLGRAGLGGPAPSLIDVLFEERLQIARTMEHANAFDSARARDVEDDVTFDGDAPQARQ